MALLRAKDWISWLDDLHTIFGDTISYAQPTILQPSLHARTQRLAAKVSIITRMEQAIGCGSAIQCILTCCEEPVLCEVQDQYIDSSGDGASEEQDGNQGSLSTPSTSVAGSEAG